MRLLCQSSLHTQHTEPSLCRGCRFRGTSTHVASLQPCIEELYTATRTGRQYKTGNHGAQLMAK